MNNIKCLVDFPVSSEEEYNTKEYLIGCLYVVSRMNDKEYDENVMKLYSIFDDNGTLYNGFISHKYDISCIEYHVSRNINSECRKELKKSISLEKLIEYILSRKIVVSNVEMCKKDEFNGKIKCINRSYDYQCDKLKVKNISDTLIESYKARQTYNTEDSYLRKNIISREKVLDDAKTYFDDLKNNARDLFLSLR